MQLPHSSVERRIVTFGEMAEAFTDAAMEVCGDPEEAKVAAALSLYEFLRTLRTDGKSQVLRPRFLLKRCVVWRKKMAHETGRCRTTNRGGARKGTSWPNSATSSLV